MFGSRSKKALNQQQAKLESVQLKYQQEIERKDQGAGGHP